MRPIEAGVDLDRVESARVALQVASARLEALRLVPSNAPACAAELNPEAIAVMWNIRVRHPTLWSMEGATPIPIYALRAPIG